MPHPEDIWLNKGAQYAAPTQEVHRALADLLAADWRAVWDKNTRQADVLSIEWYLSRQEGLLAWASYSAAFLLRQTGKQSFTAEDYWQFQLSDQISFFGKDALADEWFHHFRDYEFTTKNQGFIKGLDRALSNKGRQPNIEFIRFCFLWDRYVIPFEFWTNEAIAGRYRAATGDNGTRFNKERIRNWKRALKLKEASPPLVLAWDEATNRIRLETRREVLARIHELYGVPILELPDRKTQPG